MLLVPRDLWEELEQQVVLDHLVIPELLVEQEFQDELDLLDTLVFQVYQEQQEQQDFLGRVEQLVTQEALVPLEGQEVLVQRDGLDQLDLKVLQVLQDQRVALEALEQLDSLAQRAEPEEQEPQEILDLKDNLELQGGLDLKAEQEELVELDGQVLKEGPE